MTAGFALPIFADEGDFVNKVVVEAKGTDLVNEMVKIYASESSNPQSKLSLYLKGLKAKHSDYSIDSTITKDQVYRFESGRSGGSFEIDYLIAVQAGYKSNTFPVGFLKASASFDGDGGPGSTDTFIISGPADVKIDGSSY